MKNLTICLIVVFAVANAIAQDVHELHGIDVYRDATGELTEESVVNLKQLEARAIKQGYVTLWLTANVPYEPDESKLSDSQRKQQDAAVQTQFDKVLRPLIDAQAVWLVDKRSNVEGPSQMVQANINGLVALAHDVRILNIYADE